MNTAGKTPRCPGLKGMAFTDCLGRVYDLEREKILSTKEAADDLRLGGISIANLHRAIRGGDLYPVLRRNARVILIFDCALTDWRARQVKKLQPPVRKVA